MKGGHSLSPPEYVKGGTWVKVAKLSHVKEYAKEERWRENEKLEAGGKVAKFRAPRNNKKKHYFGFRLIAGNPEKLQEKFGGEKARPPRKEVNPN